MTRKISCHVISITLHCFLNRFLNIAEMDTWFDEPYPIKECGFANFKCVNHPGMRFSEAYKLVNFDRLTSSKGEAAKQAAINQVKGKNHLATGAALNVNDGMEDIPVEALTMYKEAFPEKTMQELKALYNKALGARR